MGPERRLSEWQQDLVKEIEDLQSRRNSLDLEIQRASKKLDLLRQMQELESPGKHPTRMENAGSEGKPTPTAVRANARAILSESDRPLHISEIHQRFLKNGFPIPGSGTAFNILAHLVNDKSFVRVARGTYAIKGSVPEDQVLAKAPRRKSRRRRKRDGALSEV